LKVMLIKDVESVGQAGDVKDVADGYGRNYLIPRRLAIVAGKGAEAEARRLRDGVAKREAKERDVAQELAELIDNKTVVVRLKVGAEDKVFGAITNDDIATALRLQHQVEVDRRKIELKDPLKQLGEHQVPLRLHRDVTANINLIITQDR
jgi:large subunit ribosomal protein L9